MKKILSALLILFLSCSGAIATDNCEDQHIALTHVTSGTPAYVRAVYQDPSSNRMYVNQALKTYVSIDKGENWAVAYDWSGVSGANNDGGSGLFVTSSGTVFICWGNTGKVHRLTWTGSALGNRTEPLTFEMSTSCFRENGIDQAPDGKIYIGEYGPAEAAGNVWRSNNDGVTWTQIFEGDSQTIRHIHCVAVDPYHQTLGQYHVYMTCGDPVDQVPHGGIFMTDEPEEASPVWKCIMEETDEQIRYKPTAIAITPNYRIFGTDVGSGEYVEDVAYNQIFRTTDDKAFTEELRVNRPLIWQMRVDSRGIIYVGTMKGAGSDEIFRIAIYSSSDEGDTWCELYGFDSALPSTYIWKGISAFSNFKERTAYVAIHDNDNPPNHPGELYRLDLGFTWHIDDDGGLDFTDILTAIADSDVGRNDSLVIHPGSYDQSGIIPYSRMKIVGSTANPHDTIIWTNSTAADVVVCPSDTTGIRLKNFEIRGQHTLTDYFVGIHLESGNTDTYIDNVNIKNINGYFNSAIYVEDGAELRLHGARIESCSTTASGKCGAIFSLYATNVIIEDSVFAENIAEKSAVYIQNQNDGSADTTNILYCFFGQNESTVEHSGGLMVQMNSSAVQRPRLEHLTFYKNTSAVATDGQLKVGGNRNDEQMDYCVFYGDGVTYPNFNDSIYMVNANYCTAFNNGNSDVITSVNKTDCIGVDPNFTNFNRYSTLGFRARSLDDDGSGSSPRFTQDGSYMGWQQYIDIGGWHNNGYYKIRRRLFFF